MRLFTASLFVLVLGFAFQPAAKAQTADVMVIHNSPYEAADTVDVYINDTLTLDDFKYLDTSGGFVALDAGVELKIDVTAHDAADNSSPVFTANVTLTDGETYYLIAAGDPANGEGNPAFGLFPVAGVRTAADTGGNAEFMVFHGSPDAPTVDVAEATAGVLVDALSFGEFSDYVSVAAADYTIQVQADENGLNLASVSAPLSGFADDAVLVLASGFYRADPGFALNVVAADGSVVTLPATMTIYPYPVDPATPEIGDNYIVYVDGANVDVDNYQGNTIVDPFDETNLVADYGMGSWTNRGFIWSESGINMEANVDRGDTLYLRLWLPEDEAQHLSLIFGDYSVSNADYNLADLGFSVGWFFPPELYTGTWHDLAIPLPFKTRAEQDSAKVGKNVDGTPMANPLPEDDPKLRWSYNDGWIGSSVTPTHPLWRDLTWYKVMRLSVSGQGSGYDWMMDDVHIGNSEADLSVGRTAPSSPLPALSSSMNATGDSVTVSWTHDGGSDIYGYTLLYKGSEITGITDDIATVAGEYKTDANLSYTFPVFSPHPNAKEQTYHLAIAGSNGYSFIPDDAPIQTISVTTEGKQVPWIYPLTQEEEDAIVANFDAGTIGLEGFRTESREPFRVVGKYTDGDPLGSPYQGNYYGPDDASATVHFAYRYNETEGYTTFYMYAEVMDNSVDNDIFDIAIWDPTYAGGSWVHDFTEYKDEHISWNVYLRDQLQVYLGTYPVDYVTGSTNVVRSRGEHPDYFMSFQPYVSSEDRARSGPIDGMLTRLWLEQGGSADGTVPDSTYYYDSRHQYVYPALYEDILDGSDNRIGYRILAAIDSEDLIADPAQTDAVFTPPADDEIMYIPFSLALVDKDDDHISGRGNSWEVPSAYIPWSTKPAPNLFEGNNTVTSVGSVAIVGKDVAIVGVDDEPAAPLEFTLAPNYPNPFTGSTNIRFTLPSEDKVTLAVYNILGQEVVRLLDDEPYIAGAHAVTFKPANLASGVYFYRIQAGDNVAVKRMTLVK